MKYSIPTWTSSVASGIAPSTSPEARFASISLPFAHRPAAANKRCNPQLTPCDCVHFWGHMHFSSRSVPSLQSRCRTTAPRPGSGGAKPSGRDQIARAPGQPPKTRQDSRWRNWRRWRPYVRRRIVLAGAPATRAKLGTSPLTTLLAPTTAPSPRRLPLVTMHPRPTHTSRPMTVGVLTDCSRMGRSSAIP